MEYILLFTCLYSRENKYSGYANFSDILISFLKVVAISAGIVDTWKKALDDVSRAKICTFFMWLFCNCDSETRRHWAKLLTTSQQLTQLCTFLSAPAFRFMMCKPLIEHHKLHRQHTLGNFVAIICVFDRKSWSVEMGRGDVSC